METKLIGLQEYVALKEYTTYKIGGSARYFFVAATNEAIGQALRWAKEKSIAVLVIGGGSNLLVADAGFDGLVIQVAITGLTLLPGNKVAAGAGVSMASLVDFSIEHSLKGLEWAGGLPGTFGGALRGNAGAFGGEIKDSILEVEAITAAFEIVTLAHHDCRFSYRSSVFKEEGGSIISAVLQLTAGDKAELRAIADSRIAYRNEKHPLEYPNSGSVFKNVPVSTVSQEVKSLFLDKIKMDPFEIIPAAWFIIGAGLAGEQVGKAQISLKHSNYIVNLGGATAQDVVALIELVKQKVKEKYGVSFEVEVQLVGF